MESGLQESSVIEVLYSAFSVNRRPASLHHSPYQSQEHVQSYAELVRSPLRDIQLELIEPYAASALTTVGDENDFRYFLPRILELTLAYPGAFGFEPWLIASKLNYGNWTSWDAAEIEALCIFFNFGFERAAVMLPEKGAEFESWLVANLALGEDAKAQLKIAVATNSKAATYNLARLIVEHQAQLIRRGNFARGIWDEVSEDRKKATVAFLASDIMKDLLIKHGSNASEEDAFMWFDPALSAVEQL